MIDKAAAGTAWPARSRAFPVAGLAALVVIALLAMNAGAPYLFKRATLQSEVATQVRTTTGLSIVTDHARFDLLPRPRVTMSGVHVSDASGLVTLDATSLTGNVRLLPLVVGRVELSAVNLAKPRLSIDLDGQTIEPNSTIGRAVRAVDPPSAGLQRRLGSVTMVGGTVALTGRSLGQPLSFSNINVTIDWRDPDSPATLTGSLQVRDTMAEVAGWIAQPSSLMRGKRSTVALRIHSAPLDFTATGDLGDETTPNFKGHVMAAAPSLDGLFDPGSSALPLPAPFANATISSDATISVDHGAIAAADLQNLNLRADGNSYEGTIAYQGGNRPLVSGTLAADQMVLAPFIARVPHLVDTNHHWSRKPLAPLDVGAITLDIRISAAHLRLAPLGIDDAALSVMTRGNRLEVGLNEGRAYGGAVKGRVSVGVGADGLNLRATGTLAAADLATLSWDALGWQAASGMLSGSANVETTGDTPAALMSNLQGWAKGGATDGEIYGVDLARGLTEASRGSPNDAPALPVGRTPFSGAAIGFHIVDSKAVVDDASLQGSAAMMTLAGTADLASRALDLHANIKQPAAAAASNGDKLTTLRFAVKGDFDHFVIAPEHDAFPQPAPAHAP